MKDEETVRELRERLSEYALRVIRVYVSLDKRDEVARVLGKQVLRSGTSPGAHYREASRARSDAEFISKMEVGIQELDETDYWFGLLVKSGTIKKEQLQDLIAETDELISIFTTIVKKTKGNKK